MKKVLHLIASPRGNDSRTLKISQSFLNTLKEKYQDLIIDELNVFTENLPEMNIMRVKGKYQIMGGENLSGAAEESWAAIKEQINRFQEAEMVVISTPMWNFGIPYKLKQYLDVVLQPGFMFKYTANGVEGMAKARKALVISTHGGDYSPQGGAASFDQLIPYLKQILGFIGIEDQNFISAQPMDAAGPDVQQEKLQAAIKEAEKLAQNM
jgi:FMN-dependent NADH-azoreductase